MASVAVDTYVVSFLFKRDSRYEWYLLWIKKKSFLTRSFYIS
jgi:hypothetical protein